MRIFLLSLALLRFILAFGQPLFLSPQPSADEVLEFLSGMGFSQEFTDALKSAFRAGFKSGRATPAVALRFLQDLSTAPRDQAAEALEIVRLTLSRGFMVDNLLNEALKIRAVGRPYKDVLYILNLRLGFLSATHSVLGRRGLISPRPPDPEASPTPEERVVTEVAWAAGNWIIWEGKAASDPDFVGYVRRQLIRLADAGVLPREETERITAALSLPLLGEIVQLVFGR